MQSFEQASAFISALGAAGQLVDFRAIHDTNKGVPAIPIRDTLENAWQSLCYYNSQGYGIFATIAMMDGNGRELSNVSWLRAHYADLDGVSSETSLQQANGWNPAPSFAVNTSPGKYHVYWSAVPYVGNDRFQIVQRKIAQFFSGDKAVIDAARVMRLPGTINTKYSTPGGDKYNGSSPHMVTCFALNGYGSQTPVEAMEAALAHVNVIDHGGGRHELGDTSLAAPSMDWLKHALALIDPNTLSRAEWISTSAAIKQAGWTLADETTLFNVWSEWCRRYVGNDEAENLKQWKSIRQTEVGWKSLQRRAPGMLAAEIFGGRDHQQPQPQPGGEPMPTPSPDAPPMPAPPPLDCSGEILTHLEQQEWFKDCVFVEKFGKIITPSLRLMDATKFNGSFGGKKFIIDGSGKTTNEAWAAATRSTLWTIPKVDHVRFLPHRPFREIITDELNRRGVNTYKPAVINRQFGNADPFLYHLAAMLPVPQDQRIYLDFLAHNARFPGHKIPWAPLIQSAEGVGKGILKRLFKYIVGSNYFYSPNAEELVSSGAQFNAWMRAKLFIVVDEIKVDERRELVEVLKPMISETEIEVQAKGVDQDIEDNYSNWAFFSNYKDAIPVNKNGRRFAIFYSPIQTVDDLERRGMTEAYFTRLYDWFDNGGNAIVADWLYRYPIERGAIPMRAPVTSSTAEAFKVTRGPVEQAIMDAIEDGAPGFRGGWVSLTAAAARAKRNVSRPTLVAILEALGYRECGRAPRAYFQESRDERAQLFNVNPGADVQEYGRVQGYE